MSVEAPYELVDDGLAASVLTARPAVVRGYVSASAGIAAVERAKRDLGHLQAFGLRPIAELETRLVQEEDWADAWKTHFPVLRVGRRLVIRPTWRQHEAADGDVVLALDPGMAFGTGLHPTTRLCLAALEELADAGHLRGARVLDVGSGSGILALAAGLLGAESVVAVDTDAIAVESTRANAALNGLDAIIQARRGTVPVDDPPFDIVLANLIASVLVDLAPALRQSVVAGGRVLASGVFIDRFEEVISAFAEASLSLQAHLKEADWVALTAVAD